MSSDNSSTAPTAPPPRARAKMSFSERLRGSLVSGPRKDKTESSAARPPGEASSGRVIASNVGATMAVLKEAAEMAENLPYIKAVAGMIVEILKIVDEVTVFKDKWKDVTSDIQDIQKIVDQYGKSFDGGGDAGRTPSANVRDHFRDLESTLQTVKDTLVLCCPKGARGNVRLALHRRELRSTVDACSERIKKALTYFNTGVGLVNTELNLDNNRLLQSITATKHVGPAQALRVKHSIPGRPQILRGRSDVIDEIICAILEKSPARIVVLGPGGIGKTTIALAVLHHEQVQSHFKNACYFIACDAISSRDALMISIAEALGVLTHSDQILNESRLLLALKDKQTILCLDNFETPWEAQRNEIEQFLTNLTGISSVHLLITMRGAERPWNVHWTLPLLLPIGPLSAQAAFEVFKDISGYDDCYSRKLVEAVDFIPLAVTLLAHLAATNNKTEKMWKRWSQEHIGMLHRNHAQVDRLSSIEFSIELSLKSSRVKQDSQCLVILSLLAMLPDGIHESQEEDLAQILLSNQINDSIQTLINCALISIDGDNNRLKVLSPIRLYMIKNHSLNQIASSAYKALQQYIGKWIQICTKTHDWQRVRHDCNNLRSLLYDSLDNFENKDLIISNVIDFIQISAKSGQFEKHLLGQCLKFLHKSPMELQFNYYERQIALHLRFDDYTDMREILANGMILATLLKDKSGQADILQYMGRWCLHTDQNEKAVECWNKAFICHAQVLDIIGLANDFRYLGDYYDKEQKFDKAKQCFIGALDAHTQLKNVQGQAENLLSIGLLASRSNKYQEAKKYLEKSLKLFIETRSIYGQAQAFQYLGNLYRKMNDPKKAKMYVEKALNLSIESNSTTYQAECCEVLAMTYMDLNDLDQAMTFYKKALEGYITINSKSHQSGVLAGLGQLFWKLKNVQEALQYLYKAYEIAIDCKSIYAQADTCYLIGHYEFSQENYKQAKIYLQKALLLYKNMDDQLLQAQVLRLFAEMDVKSKNYSQALQHLQNALNLYKERNDVSGQANVLQSLGNYYLLMKDWDQAGKYFQKAFQIHTKANLHMDQINDLGGLAQVYLLQHQLYKAKECLLQKLHIHMQIKDTAGQDHTKQSLATLELVIQIMHASGAN